jgi:hypothetical protein
MLKRQAMKTLTTGGAFAALLILGMSIVPSFGRADNDHNNSQDEKQRAHNDNNGSQDEKQSIQTGLSVASSNGIQLNMAGKDRDMVGLGSYLVNVVGDCNGCHSSGPAHEWCCDVAGNSNGTGNPYLLSPPFTGKKVNPLTYLGGGRDFGGFPTPASPVHIVSRNLTPDNLGQPAGHSLSDFKQILRTGIDFDQLHPNCPVNAPNCLNPPFNGGVLQVMRWPAFQNMTDRQLEAMYIYLSSIPSLP